MFFVIFWQDAGEQGLTVICEVCGQECPEEKLRDHIKMMHETGTFPCQTCGKVFDHKDRLAQHMFTHTKSHICEYCGQAFAHTGPLNAHVEAKHKGKVSAL
jgi:KRAB domain-containing zinc finger protein